MTTFLAVAVHSSDFTPFNYYVKALKRLNLEFGSFWWIWLFIFHLSMSFHFSIAMFRSWGDRIWSLATFDGRCSSQFCSCILHWVWTRCKRSPQIFLLISKPYIECIENCLFVRILLATVHVLSSLQVQAKRVWCSILGFWGTISRIFCVILLLPFQAKRILDLGDFGDKGHLFDNITLLSEL